MVVEDMVIAGVGTTDDPDNLDRCRYGRYARDLYCI